MNVTRLESIGWTKKEIRHLKTVLRRAEKKKPASLHFLEHALLWVVVLALTLAGIAWGIDLIPFILLSGAGLAVPIVFLLGTCIGLLFVHVLHDLRLETAHHHAGAIVLAASTLLSMTVVLSSIASRMNGTSSLGSMALIAATFAVGILLTYVVHWRFTHAAS